MTKKQFLDAVNGIDDELINEFINVPDIPDIPRENYLADEKPQVVYLANEHIPFWKIAVSAAAAVCILTVGFFGGLKLSGIQSAESSPGVSLNYRGDFDISLERSITSAKCYKVEFQEITEDQVAALFKALPQKETDEFGTTHFTSDGERAFLNPDLSSYGNGTYYYALYCTEQGDSYDTAAYKRYSEIAENKDWSFMSAAEAEKKIADILSGFMPTGVSVKAYAISADYYSKYFPAGYYYFTIEQTVDGIPIEFDFIGQPGEPTHTWSPDASAVLSEEGLGFSA